MMIYKSKVTIATRHIEGTFEDVHIRVTKWPTQLGYFFKIKPKVLHYEGGCTVFYKIKDNYRKRCSTLEESWLSNIWGNFMIGFKKLKK